MKIAQLVPPWLPVPPTGYGGIERIVSYLTEELVSRGHEVTLFATGDSKTRAKLFPTYPKALGNIGELKKNLFYLLFPAIDCFERSKEFDIIHTHMGHAALFLSQLVKTPVVHTLHGTIAAGEVSEEKRKVLLRFKKQNFISISDDQRKGMPDLNFVATVYNGIPIKEFDWKGGRGDYLCWLGRITPKKGLDHAIAVAKKTGIPLKIAAFIDSIDKPYYDDKIKPLIDNTQIQMLGELSQKERSQFLGGALAFLFPIAWHEPFGLVMTEAMASGTPVVSYGRGSAPEIVVDGKTGYLINPSEDEHYGDFKIQPTGVGGMVAAVEKLRSMPLSDYEAIRSACRQHVEKHFSVAAMVSSYEEVYKKVAPGS